MSARDVAAVTPHFLLALTIAGLDWLRLRQMAPVSFDLSGIERLLIASRALVFYLGRLLWPSPSPVIFPRWIPDATPSAWGYLGLVVLAAVALGVARRRFGRGPAAALLFFALALGPTLGLVDFGYMRYSFVADRFQYLAAAGPMLLAGAIAARGIVPRFPNGARAAGIVVLGGLAVLTWRQASVWESDERLFRHVTDRNPAAWDGWHNLGSALVKQPGGRDEAIACFRRALTVQPGEAKVHYDLGTALLDGGAPDEAREHLERAVELEPGHADAHRNLGILLARTGRPAEAEASFRRAVALRPDDAQLHANLARLLERQGRRDEAREAFRAAARLGHAEAAERLRELTP